MCLAYCLDNITELPSREIYKIKIINIKQNVFSRRFFTFWKAVSQLFMVFSFSSGYNTVFFCTPNTTFTVKLALSLLDVLQKLVIPKVCWMGYAWTSIKFPKCNTYYLTIETSIFSRLHIATPFITLAYEKLMLRHRAFVL